MSELTSLGDYRAAPSQSFVQKAAANKDNPQIRLCRDLGVESSLMDERAVEVQVAEPERRLQMRS